MILNNIYHHSDNCIIYCDMKIQDFESSEIRQDGGLIKPVMTNIYNTLAIIKLLV